MAKVLTIFGTRPEAIKMAPVINAMSRSLHLEILVCVSAQHRGLLDQVLDHFSISPDYDLDLMRPNQDLFHITSSCLLNLQHILQEVSPDLVLVHGDTTTAFSAALSAFYSGIDVGHVEAGLRSHNQESPFPEEANRRLIGSLAKLHFTPSPRARENLILENNKEHGIYVTGNTGIDALYQTLNKLKSKPELDRKIQNRKLVLLTAHRREVDSKALAKVFRSIRQFALESPEFIVIFPLHPNKRLGETARSVFAGVSNVALVDPLSYEDCVYLLSKSQFVISDSGGLQEEAPALGKPILILRQKTERPEVLEQGAGLLVGHDAPLIIKMMRALKDPLSPMYRSMSRVCTPYGNGQAAEAISRLIEEHCHPETVLKNGKYLKTDPVRIANTFSGKLENGTG